MRLSAPQPYPIRTSTRPKGENHREITARKLMGPVVKQYP